MRRRVHDPRQLDLLSWEPPQLTQSYREEKIRSASLKARLAEGIARTLKESSQTREETAQAMSLWHAAPGIRGKKGGEEVKKTMLDAYASPAREAHTISYLRLLALRHVTGDDRLLQLGASLFHFLPRPEYTLFCPEFQAGRARPLLFRRAFLARPCSVIEDHYLPWVDVGPCPQATKPVVAKW